MECSAVETEIRLCGPCAFPAGGAAEGWVPVLGCAQTGITTVVDEGARYSSFTRFLRKLGFRTFLRRRMDFGVTSTSSSSSM